MVKKGLTVAALLAIVARCGVLIAWPNGKNQYNLMLNNNCINPVKPRLSDTSYKAIMPKPIYTFKNQIFYVYEKITNYRRFASRQDPSTPETWLSSKCTCPVCRAKFCILDVSSVKIIEA